VPLWQSLGGHSQVTPPCCIGITDYSEKGPFHASYMLYCPVRDESRLPTTTGMLGGHPSQRRGNGFGGKAVSRPPLPSDKGGGSQPAGPTSTQFARAQQAPSHSPRPTFTILLQEMAGLTPLDDMVLQYSNPSWGLLHRCFSSLTLA
jgi:hypothetical protein